MENKIIKKKNQSFHICLLQRRTWAANAGQTDYFNIIFKLCSLTANKILWVYDGKNKMPTHTG